MAEAVPPAVMTAAEYSEEVSKWLQQAYQWQLFAVGEFTKSHEFQRFDSLIRRLPLVHGLPGAEAAKLQSQQWYKFTK